MSKEEYKPSEQEINTAESMMTDEQRESSKEREVELAQKELRDLLEHAKSGELTSEDAENINEILNALGNPTLGFIVQSLERSKEDGEEARQSTEGKMLLEIFSDSNSLATLKEFSVRAYEEEALKDPESSSFKKLRAFANIAQQIGNDDELSRRFSTTTGEAISFERPATEEDVQLYAGLGRQLTVGDTITGETIPWPKSSYRKE